ncbi:class I SAM-dependent methyltransferase [Patescibacteria group bacterium]|nr:class I SAM-dependent methyltransferase [Patescibacteria group bacterium]
MKVLVTTNFPDYQLLDTGNGKRLERFGKFVLVRPDPQILWQPHLNKHNWEQADAVFGKDRDGKEKWLSKKPIPEKWLLKYKNLAFYVKLSPFKHTGVFPEQAVHWDFINQKIKGSGRGVNILNLFGYTGISSLAAAEAGAKVTHLDASRPTIGWARENQQASGLDNRSIRWILDDALKFTGREIRRGVKYDGIIMDPPVYGHGPEGEKWDFNEHFPQLLKNCQQILSATPLFLIINAYAISASALMLQNLLEDLSLGGTIEAGELALPEEGRGRLLSTGIFARWSNT